MKIEVKNLTKYFGNFKALENINLNKHTIKSKFKHYFKGSPNG